MLIGLGWGYRIMRRTDTTAAERARAAEAAEWLAGLASGGPVVAVTHGAYRRLLANRLLALGWTCTSRIGGYRPGAPGASPPRCSMSADQAVRVRSTLRPGDVGTIIRLHGTIYGAEYGWDPTFEAMVAETLARFVLAGEGAGRLWVAERGGAVAGCIAIVGQADGSAQLRWFLVDPAHRGAGVGRMLLDEALAFCRAEGFRSVYLWTVSSLEAAAHLYRSAGFRVTQEETHVCWGATVTEQRYDLVLED